jgi:aminomethyltransferase
VSDLRRSPLHARHIALGAKMADFGGWDMPIEYAGPGGGVVAEHTAVRSTVGLFDVSHLGKATVLGAGAREFVNACLTADLGKIDPGQAQYTLCCNDAGGVVDDVFSYLVSDDEVFLMPNAANAAAILRLLDDAAGRGLVVTDHHEDFAVIAVQGPDSAAVLEDAGLPSDLAYLSFVDTEFAGNPLRVCRTGYTGEHGYELIPLWGEAERVWDALAEAVRARGGLPAALGARDTLRTEMGYPLHGQDLTPEITPLQANSSWAVGWKKDRFWGRDALLAERAAGPARRLFGLLVTDRGVPRPGMTVRRTSGETLGTTTSGTFSPTLKKGIALALLSTVAIAVGDAVEIDVRGRAIGAEVVSPPFVPSHVR